MEENMEFEKKKISFVYNDSHYQYDVKLNKLYKTYEGKKEEIKDADILINMNLMKNRLVFGKDIVTLKQIGKQVEKILSKHGLKVEIDQIVVFGKNDNRTHIVPIDSDSKKYMLLPEVYAIANESYVSEQQKEDIFEAYYYIEVLCCDLLRYAGWSFEEVR